MKKTLLCLLCALSFNAVSILTASTAKTIIGTAPQLVPGTDQYTSLASHSSFTVNNVKYNWFDGTYNTSLIFDYNLTLGDFVINGLSKSDFLSNYYYDSEGDGVSSSDPLNIGTLTYNWTDNDEVSIPSSANINTLHELSYTYSFPLKLSITNTGVYTTSGYGSPNVSDSLTISQVYQIHTERGIYAIKPNSVGLSCQWVEYINNSWVCASQSTSGQTGYRSATTGGGYTSDYTPDLGFKKDPSGDTFPTVGFPGAQFQLVMIGKPSEYTFSVVSGSGVTVDANGIVKLSSKPSSTVTLRAIYDPSGLATTFDYSFTIGKWLEPKTGTSNYADAITKCGGEANMITRSDFTNSPIANIATGQSWSYIRNYGTRAIDGTLYGEWGYMDGNTYPDSNWQNNRYWTKDVNSDNTNGVNTYFFVHSYDGGYIGYEWQDNTEIAAVCK
ncbi:hypothetical protein GCM10023211_06420 [Orbus sasakiae]|uniref:Uncharacterized protein n=1 Tax=Orbus sasakiae TaxID=1078475 RepID=A0ABP9N346_9GAMM